MHKRPTAVLECIEKISISVRQSKAKSSNLAGSFEVMFFMSNIFILMQVEQFFCSSCRIKLKQRQLYCAARMTNPEEVSWMEMKALKFGEKKC